VETIDYYHYKQRLSTGVLIQGRS